MVVGGGGGGTGSGNNNSGGSAGAGGGVTILKDIYLGGTGTVSIVVGAGSNGTAGTSTAATGVSPSIAGYSGFGTYVYSSGGRYSSWLGQPGYKGTTSHPYGGADTTSSNFAPTLLQPAGDNAAGNYIGTLFLASNVPSGFYSSSSYTDITQGFTLDGTGYGMTGGTGGYQNNTGSPAGFTYAQSGANASYASLQLFGPNTPLPWGASTVFTLGTASAGGNSSDGHVGGVAGNTGYAGGGGGFYNASPYFGVCGAQGAGGGGAACSTAGGTGGTGGNGGTNTGGGGGAGGYNNQTSGTGGSGGNGGSGLVIVSYIGTN
jgi:hypothetical protein